MIRKFYDIIIDLSSGGNMSNSDTNDKPSNTTKAEQSSTSLPQNPDNWRKEREALSKEAYAYAEPFSYGDEVSDVGNQYYHAAAQGYAHGAMSRDEEIERLREELTDKAKKFVSEWEETPILPFKPELIITDLHTLMEKAESPIAKTAYAIAAEVAKEHMELYWRHLSDLHTGLDTYSEIIDELRLENKQLQLTKESPATPADHGDGLGAKQNPQSLEAQNNK